MYDRDKQSTEFGIEPDYNVAITDADALQSKDTIIEFARKKLAEWLKKQTTIVVCYEQD